MVRFWRNLATTGLVISLAACETAPGPQSLAPGASVQALTVFESKGDLSNAFQTFEIGGVNVPLPEGRWTLIGDKDLTTSPNYPARAYVLASETNGAIDRVVTLWRQRTFGGRFLDFTRCSLASNLSSDVKSQAARTTDCVYVRAVSWPDKGRLGGLLRSYAKSKELYAPLVTVGPRVALSLSGTDRIAIDYSYNTDLLAPPSNATFWRPEDWTPDGASAGARKAVVEAMREFGAVIRPQVAQANLGAS